MAFRPSGSQPEFAASAFEVISVET